jgi:hypothetical protein
MGDINDKFEIYKNIRKDLINEDKMGKLLWKEPLKEFDVRGGMVRWLGYTFIGLAIFLSPYGFLLESGFLLVFAIITFSIGLIFVFLSKTLHPIQIFENGIFIFNDMWRSGNFISWGDVQNIKEYRGLSNSYYDIENKAGGKLRIRSDITGLSGTIENIRDRLGKLEFQVDFHSKEKIRTQKKMELWTYPSAVAISIIVAFFMIIYYNYFITFNEIFMVFGFVIPWISIVSIGMVLHMLADWRSTFFIKIKVKLRHFIAFIVVMNIIYITTVGSSFTILPSQYDLSQDFRNEDIPIDYYEGGFDLVGGTFNLYESIYVQSGSVFTISDSLVVFGSNDNLGIYVEKTGHLIIENSTLSSNDPKVGYWFEVYGKLTVYNSVIEYVWGDPYYENKDGGIELYNAEATFEDSNIQNCITNGILASDSILSIFSSTIENCEDDGIELHGTSARIDDIIIRYSSWPIMFWDGSDAYVSNSTFDRNDYGMWILRSSPVIEDCIFQDTKEGAAIIIFGSNSKPIMSGNEFDNNDTEVDYLTSSSAVCYIFLLPFLSVFLIIIIQMKNMKIAD